MRFILYLIGLIIFLIGLTSLFQLYGIQAWVLGFITALGCGIMTSST